MAYLVFGIVLVVLMILIKIGVDEYWEWIDFFSWLDGD